MDVALAAKDRFVTVDGLNTRYMEEGTGVPVVLLHGNSLGSSMDVWRRNLGPLAAGGMRVIAFDIPGFGQTPEGPTFDNGFRKKFLVKFMDALSLDRAAVIGHSAAGNIAVGVGLDQPSRITHLMVLGTGSLLPPLEASGTKVGGNEGAAQARLEERMVKQEPALSDTRALLEANLFHHELITDEELALRHQNSIGDAFKNFAARHAASKGESENKAKTGTPLWQRMVDLSMPLRLIFGKQDRARAAERAALLHEKFPQLDLHMAEGCKHLVPWDAAEMFQTLAVELITGKKS